MSKDEALTILTQVTEAYKGNAQEHRLLAQALVIIRELIKDKDKPET